MATTTPIIRRSMSENVYSRVWLTWTFTMVDVRSSRMGGLPRMARDDRSSSASARERRLRADSGRQSPREVHPKSQCDFNNIWVRSYIQTGPRGRQRVMSRPMAYAASASSSLPVEYRRFSDSGGSTTSPRFPTQQMHGGHGSSSQMRTIASLRLHSK